MNYELSPLTSRRAPKLSSPAITKAYRKLPKEDKRMSDKSATERLREMLDEREVEWWNDTDPEPQRQTNVWAGGQLVMFHENANGTVGYVVYSTHDLTPEQAIAATLGNDGVERSKNGVTERGTCHITVRDNMAETEGMGDYWLECDACHWQMPLEPSTPRFNYCPNCGRKVVVDE